MGEKVHKSLSFFPKIFLGLAFFVFGYGVGVSGWSLNVDSENLGKVTIDRQRQGGNEDVDFSLFWTVWDRVSEMYVDAGQVDQSKMVHGAISGMVSALGDPYTVFLPPRQNKDSKDDLGGTFEGVGIQLGFSENDQLSVIAPLLGTPAEKAGVKAGDLILKIKDEEAGVDRETIGITLPEAVDLIRGPRGSEVLLTLAREGVAEPFEVSLRRDTIVVKSVEVKFQDADNDGDNQRVAIITLNRFGGRTDTEWAEVVEQVKTEEARNGEKLWVVLDLRNNPGGFLDGAVWVAAEFLDDGVVVKQENRDASTNRDFEVTRRGELLDEPMVVIVNEGTASAAEILAGALSEHGRVTLVGEQTFGKGSVQQPEDLPGGSGIHVTVGRWLLPSGNSVDKVGVAPQIVVENDDDETIDEQLEAAINELVANF